MHGDLDLPDICIGCETEMITLLGSLEMFATTEQKCYSLLETSSK